MSPFFGRQLVALAGEAADSQSMNADGNTRLHLRLLSPFVHLTRRVEERVQHRIDAACVRPTPCHSPAPFSDRRSVQAARGLTQESGGEASMGRVAEMNEGEGD